MSVTNTPASRFTSGVSTSPRLYLFGNYPYPTPARVHEYFNDFDTYAAGDWTVTTGGTGTTALGASGNGGYIVSTTNNVANDIQGNTLVTKSFAITSGSQAWFAINFKLTAITQSAFLAGWFNGGATGPTGPSDGIFFRKGATSSTLNMVLASGSSVTTAALGTLVADTFYTVGWYYTGSPSPSLFGYSTIPYTTGTANQAGTTGPTAFGTAYYTGGNQRILSWNADGGNSSTAAQVLTNLPTANLTAGWSLQTNTTVAQVATIDYMLSASEIIARY